MTNLNLNQPVLWYRVLVINIVLHKLGCSSATCRFLLRNLEVHLVIAYIATAHELISDNLVWRVSPGPAPRSTHRHQFSLGDVGQPSGHSPV